jgi:uncharacterized membrane protein YkvA (DUF1232 family)
MYVENARTFCREAAHGFEGAFEALTNESLRLCRRIVTQTLDANMSVLASLKSKAKHLKQHTLTVYFVARDPRTPILIKLMAVLIAAYALSPIDLIPDFIPVIGYLDDLLIIPLGLALVVRLTPSEILESARLQAQQSANRPVSYSAAAFITVLWLVALWFIVRWVLSVVRI